jgi:hypothetical protein
MYPPPIIATLAPYPLSLSLSLPHSAHITVIHQAEWQEPRRLQPSAEGVSELAPRPPRSALLGPGRLPLVGAPLLPLPSPPPAPASVYCCAAAVLLLLLILLLLLLLLLQLLLLLLLLLLYTTMLLLLLFVCFCLPDHLAPSPLLSV